MNPELIQQYTLFEIPFINIQDLGIFFLKFAIDLFFATIIIRFIFYRAYKNRDHVFTTFLLNIAIFVICFMMAGIKLKIGFAFGLFAVFSIIRYRTEQIPIREMTYMFIAIMIGVINALADKKISYSEVILANLIVTLTTFFVENNFLHKKEYIKMITYEKIDLIRPENYNLLLADLTKRTGFNIRRVEIDMINFMNDTAKLKIFYELLNTPSNEVDVKAD